MYKVWGHEIVTMAKQSDKTTNDVMADTILVIGWAPLGHKNEKHTN